MGFFVSSISALDVTVWPAAVRLALIVTVLVEPMKLNGVVASSKIALYGKVNRCGLLGRLGSSGTTAPLKSKCTFGTGSGMDGAIGGFARFPAVRPRSPAVNPSTTTYTAGSITAPVVPISV